MQEQEEIIDLQKLTSKQLLIRLLDRVDDMSRHIEKMEKDQRFKQEVNDKRHIDLIVKITTLETAAELKGRHAGSLWGFIVALVTSVISALITWIVSH